MALTQDLSTPLLMPTTTQITNEPGTMVSSSKRKSILGHFAQDLDFEAERSRDLKAKSARTRPDSETEVTRHSLRSTSALHSQVTSYKPQITKARIDREQNRARCPGIDQTPVPTWVIVKECTDGPAGDNLRAFKREMREDLLLLRIAKSTGLRQWEWALGEPFDSDPGFGDESAIDDNEDTDVRKRGEDRLQVSRNSCQTPAHQPRTQSYARRRAAFTYTYGDDPIFRGRKFVLGGRRGRTLYPVPGDWSTRVSPEDGKYKPDTEDLPHRVDAKPFLREVTAGDFLVAPGQRDGMDSNARARKDFGCSAVSDESED